MSFRIEKIPSKGFRSLNEKLISYYVVLFFGLGASFVALLAYITFKDTNVKNLIPLYNLIRNVSIVVFILGLVSAIWGFIKRMKFVNLLKNGIVLKNIPFVTEDSIFLTKVKIDYKDEKGKKHVFRGIISEKNMKYKNVCDVLVNQNDYSKYMVMNDIS